MDSEITYKIIAENDLVFLEKGHERYIIPKEIFVDGMPLFLRGYNGKYKLKKRCESFIYERIENVPCYYFIPIMESWITYKDGEWVFYHEICKLPFSKKGPFLLGEWQGGIFVSDKNSLKSLWASNKGFFNFILIVIVIILLINFKNIVCSIKNYDA